MDKTFLIVDNQPLTRSAVTSLVKGLYPLSAILTATDRRSLLHTLRDNRDVVLILDYTLIDISGAEDVLLIRESFPDSEWLLLSDELAENFIRRLLAGPMRVNVGSKADSIEDISRAISDTANGFAYLSGSYDLGKEPLTTTAAPIEILTSSERSILHDIAVGKTTKEIASERHLSFHTINTHRRNIFRKLGVNNLHEATRYAFKAGIVEISEYYI